MNYTAAIVYASRNGKGDWVPVHPDIVPEFVKKPENMGRLLAGQMCFDASVGDKGSLWYRAEAIQ